MKAGDHIMNDDWWKQKIILWMMKAKDNVMKDVNDESEDSPMNDEWWKQKIILWMMNDESRRSYCERWMMKAEDLTVNDEWWKQEIILWIMKGEGWRQRIVLWMMNDESRRSYDPHIDIILERDNALSTNPIVAKSRWIPLPYKKGNQYPQSPQLNPPHYKKGNKSSQKVKKGHKNSYAKHKEF